MIHRGDSVGEEGRFDHPNSPRSRLTFKPYARSSSGLKALSGRRSCDFRRNPWHGHDRTPRTRAFPVLLGLGLGSRFEGLEEGIDRVAGDREDGVDGVRAFEPALRFEAPDPRPMFT